MPLLGHAFTGIATALIVSSNIADHKKPTKHFISPFLPVTLITLAYLPDIFSQLFLYLNWNDGRNFGHSLLFAIIFAIPAGLVLFGQTPFTIKQSFSLAFISITLHDILDILQSTDRQPFWPFHTTIIDHNLSIIPIDPIKELLLFTSLYCVILIYYYFRRQRNLPYREKQQPQALIQVWSARLLIIIVIASAVITHQLRSQRLHEYQKVLPYLKQQNYAELLPIVDKVDKWPRIAKAGRTDYYRGVIYMKQRKTKLAEEYLLRAYSQDKTFFWCIADLAILYATSNNPQEIRLSLATPYIKQLQTQFSIHTDYHKNMTKIQHHLSTSN